MFRVTFKFDNFYFNYHIDANQVNFSPFSRFELRTPGVHYSVPPNVHLGTVEFLHLDILLFDLSLQTVTLLFRYRYRSDL